MTDNGNLFLLLRRLNSELNSLKLEEAPSGNLAQLLGETEKIMTKIVCGSKEGLAAMLIETHTGRVKHAIGLSQRGLSREAIAIARSSVLSLLLNKELFIRKPRRRLS